MQYIKRMVVSRSAWRCGIHGGFTAGGRREGERLALPNAEIMIHQPSGGKPGPGHDIQIRLSIY
jgi:ATP-dependent Clp protease protease subunit